MDTTVKALKNLYVALGGNPADVADMTVIPDVVDAIGVLKIPAITISAEEQSAKLFNVNVSSMQSADTAVANGAITGTLANITTGVLARDWGAGHFMALKLTASDWSAFDSVLVGLNPSVSSGLVEIKDDPDHNGVFKVTNKDEQKFVVIAKIGDLEKVYEFDLSGLTLS
ncbi:MAG: hypothetical protein J6S67_25495 [Methanobrevibacter sp.]|nr:hypothetical protein [Methanobrevibacter sp.]